MTRAPGVLAGFALVAAPLAAQEPPQEGRIWRGMLGEQAITACFEEVYDSAGVYYVDTQLEPVRLVRDEEARPHVLRESAGREDPAGAVWTLETASEDRVVGERGHGDEALPIRLTSVTVPLPEYGSACESAAFLEPLLAGGTITRTPASFEGAAYTELAYRGPARAGLDEYEVTSLALDPERPGDDAINRALASALPDGTAAHPMGQCAGFGIGRGIPGYSGEFLEPLLIAPRWLGIRHAGSSYCGGAHPNHFSGLAVYDRDSGAQVDPATWFVPGALVFYEWERGPGEIRPVATLSEALTRAVLAHWSPTEGDAECVEAARDNSGWDIGVTREGPVFVPHFPHVIFACTEEVVLPWAEARPFLSDEGRAVMDSLR